SLWFFSIQGAMTARSHHTQLGSNPELATVFHKLVPLMSLPLVLVFVFDGPLRPGMKRRKRVGAAAHWMKQPFKDFVLAFGYHVRQAPGEAEAELARMNQAGFIDAVLMDDSDVLLFGARLVIRNPHVKRKPDIVATYHTNDIARDPDTPIIRSGMLLYALLVGGDYSKVGLQGCGMQIAYGLTHTELGTELLLAVDEDNETISCFLPAWRAKLRHHLANDPHDFIGRRNRKLAASIPRDFPSMEVVKLYTNPLVSDWAHMETTTTWGRFQLLDLATLSTLAERFFLWKSAGLLERKFQSKLFDAFCIKYLIMVCFMTLYFNSSSNLISSVPTSQA
ncbi:PIN domain-like protein, partial [Dendrothele bispora CBS 962.96]